MARDIDPEKEAASCTGKIRFPSFSQVQKVMKRSRRNGKKDNRGFDMREPYRCEVCHGYHLGAKSGKFQKKAFARFIEKYRGR